ncbi:hypothetical protein ACGFZK_08395 [Streptomyces sp. NPDC048257]|uniref:hypothetical protein n=1 Tax=Streptomyces sp. NPDC048257 TaxID=3365526 RepID=UPI003718492F
MERPHHQRPASAPTTGCASRGHFRGPRRLPGPNAGISGAENLPDAVPRPRLHATATWTKDGWTHHADLLSRIAHSVVFPQTPELLADPGLDDARGPSCAERRTFWALPADRESVPLL